MSESLFEAATAVLTGFDVNQARQWREEDRQWRRADLEFRQLERQCRDQELQFMQHAHQWRAQDVEQMTLDNARAIWDRCVETNRRDIEERAEQLKSISNLAALVAGFAMISFLQFQFQVTDASQAITMGFGISTALVVALNVNAMMMCALIHASILKSGPEYVSDAEEADFMSRCRQFAHRYQRGDRPPAPRRHFRAHWNNRCEGEWRRAFYMFSAGIPIFLANMAFAGWIKFSPRLGFQAGTPIIISALMGLGTVYFLLSHGRWASHILTKAAQSSEHQLDSAGLPWDWHLPPKLHLASPKADLAQSFTAANSDVELAACMPDSALSETGQAGALLDVDPQPQLSAGYIAAAVQRRLDSLAVPSIHTMRSKEGANVRHAVGIANIPDFRRGDVALKYVKRGYHVLCTHALTLLLLPVAVTTTAELANLVKSGQLKEMWHVACQTHLQFNMVMFLACCLLLVLVAVTYVLTRKKPVYLVDYFCYKPPNRMKATRQAFKDGSRASQMFDARALDFQEKILDRSGLGDETYLPDAVQARPPQISMRAAREEAELVLFESVDAILQKNKLKPSQIDILVVNCSLFNPTPSLSSMIINHFKMRSNIISYNLAGMGCSAGVIAINLAKELLQVYPNSNAIVVSTENITQNWYFGNERSMLIPNCLFRVGGACMLLSNKRRDYWRAKYELLHVVRTHMGSDDANYGCVFQREDETGRVGVHLSKDLMSVAGHALKANITTLGPLVLPISEQLLFFVNLVARKVFKIKTRSYIPDFKLAFEHFCLHTGGRGVIEEIEKQLQLAPNHVQPSKDTLWRYGNTSSSSIWYVLSNIESTQGVRKGDRVWQIAFGSGFKCNSAVWRSLRNNRDVHEAWSEDTVV